MELWSVRHQKERVREKGKWRRRSPTRSSVPPTEVNSEGFLWRMAPSCPKKLSRARIHLEARVCLMSYWQARGGHVFPSLVANIPFTVFDSTSLCDFSGKERRKKKSERNQSANKLRVLSQPWWRKERPERLWILTESLLAR